MFGQNHNDHNEPQPDGSLAAGDDSTQVTSFPPPTPPSDDTASKDEPKTDFAALAASSDDVAPEAPNESSPPSPSTNANPSDLLNIKKEALEHLSPLVSKLDQPPEEKFKTLMMMIQASDDQSLVSAAYEAANAIEDEKVRAQALLDIVNEINYFTQHQS